MYNSSLEQFLTLFDYSIDNSEKVTAPTKRVEIIIKYLTLYVYKYINRGLFEKDKTTFVLMVCFKIMQTANKISAADISCFLKSGASLDLRSERSKPFNFIADKIWLNLLALSRHHFSGDNIAFFRDLPDTISRNEVAWKQFTEKNEPENQPIPDYAERIASEKEIGPFIQLCLIRSLREDRSLVAC
jgi:dynein heavy chain